MSSVDLHGGVLPKPEHNAPQRSGDCCSLFVHFVSDDAD